MVVNGVRQDAGTLLPAEGNPRVVPLLTKLACRTFAVLLLISGVAVGVHMGLTEDGITPVADDPRAVAKNDLAEAQDEQQQDTYDFHATYAKNAANQDAESKADSVADVAADQAKALDAEYKDAKEEEKEKEEGNGGGSTVDIPSSCNEFSGNKAAGCALLLEAGFGLDEMGCLEPLWDKESGWNHKASNTSSGAYGIPQALPGDKMASEGDDWRTNPDTQIKWGLGYIKGRYGTPCSAWQHSQDVGWY